MLLPCLLRAGSPSQYTSLGATEREREMSPKPALSVDLKVFPILTERSKK